MAGTIADISALEPTFTVERFEPVGERLEVAGHWRGLRGRRFVRPVLWLHNGESRRRLVAVLDHKPWAADDGDAWLAAFVWDGGKLVADRAELEVGSELVVELPLPGARKKPAPAQKRKPTEAQLLRDQLAAEVKERREVQRALAVVEREADALATVRAERDGARAELEKAHAEVERRVGAVRDEAERQVSAARAEAERAREDGERLVNDEYRQRERAERAADEAAQALDLAQRQLAAAREAHAALEGRLAAERDEAVATRTKLLGAHDRLVAELETLREQLAAVDDPSAFEAERERLERELAAAWAEHERRSAELGAARQGRERVEAELVAVRADRKRLERELADHREEAERRPLRRTPPASATSSRIAPPRAGAALWTARAVSLALVALLLVAIVFVVARVA